MPGLLDKTPPSSTTPLGMRVLRADGQRIDLQQRDIGMRLAAVRQAWQEQAWGYRDLIGELRYAHQLLARQVARCSFGVGILVEPGQPAILASDTDDKIAKSSLISEANANMARLGIDDNPDGMIATLAENLATAAECWIHGEPDGSEEVWTVRSISEVSAMGDSIFINELPGDMMAGQRKVDPEREELLRCWIRHPRWRLLADGPLQALAGACETILLIDQEIRSATRSRIAANGILKVANSLSLATTRQESEDFEPEGQTDDDFIAGLVAAITAPIRNEGHVGAVAPIVIRGEKEDLESLDHLTLDRADPEKLMERLDTAIYRLLRCLDIQPEQVRGVGDLNHWSGWLVEATSIRHQVAPMAAIVAGCLTRAFLRPALHGLGWDQRLLGRIVVLSDASPVAENPNREQAAESAHDRMTISDQAFRKALLFSETDAPDEEEVRRRVRDRSMIRSSIRGIDVGTTSADRAISPGQITPNRPTPVEPTSVVAAAGGDDGWAVDTATGLALAEIDSDLITKLVTAGDAAVARAVERAGGRARNAVPKDRQMADLVASVDTTIVAFTIGRARLEQFTTLSSLLAGAYERLAQQVSKWLSEAARAVANLVAGSSKQRREALETELSRHTAAAWDAFAAGLDTATEAALFRSTPLIPESTGGEEAPGLVVPKLARHVLTVAGGGVSGSPDGGGMASGPIVRESLAQQGTVVLGWEWRYRPERPRGATFLPHMMLDGERFSVWTDPVLEVSDNRYRWIGTHFHPGDHGGCRCDAAILLARPTDPDLLAARLAQVGHTPRSQAVAQLAEEDATAGRIGTSAANEHELRRRITADVERLRRDYVRSGA